MQLTEERNSDKLKPYIISGICIVTFLCFIHTLHNQFTNWDDDYYVTNNPYIKAFTWVNLNAIFTQNITINYYHPLTLLSLAFNYHFSQLSPMGYYLTNILLHVANVSLVFLLANVLFTKVEFIDKKGVLFISSTAALWFGIHPMHVESVSWIAERKDVLYTFFYLLGLISYVKYISVPQTPKGALNYSQSGSDQSPFRGLVLTKKIASYKWKWYVVTFLFFIASCLSKPMAVVFPISLFCIDFLLKRSWGIKIIIEKIPLFLVALVFGLISYHFAQQSNTILSFGNIPLGKKILFASYGFVMYVAKFFAPFHLSTFYPYPCINMELHVDMPLPLFYYFSLWIALLIIVIPLYVTYKWNKNYFRILVFGLGFFLANIVFELQFISAGMAIMADRYSYVSYISLLFATTFFLNEIIKHFPVYKITIFAIVAGFTVLLSYLCVERTKVWLTGESLFKDALVQYGDEVSLFNKALGNYYMDRNEPQLAIEYYAQYARLNNDGEVLNELGNLYKSQKDYPNAAKYYERLIASGASPSTTYIKVSDVWATMGQTDSAVVYFKKAQAIDLQAANEYYSKIEDALFKVKQYKNAINHYNVQIAADTANPDNYSERGRIEGWDGEWKEEIADLLEARKRNPIKYSRTALSEVSRAYHTHGDSVNAKKYYEMANEEVEKMRQEFFMSQKKKKNIHPDR